MIKNGTFRYTPHRDYSEQSSIKLSPLRDLTIIPPDYPIHISPDNDGELAISLDLSFTIVKTMLVDNSFYTDGKFIALNAGGLYLDWSDGNSAATFYGQKYGDLLIGSPRDDKLFGMDGNDELRGGNGDDRLDGGKGYDQLIGGKGNDYFIGNGNDYFIRSDRFDGGPGRDTVDYSQDGREIAVYVSLGSIDRSTDRPAYGDEFISIEDAIGTIYRNVLEGNDSNNTLVGLRGEDNLIGEGGRDVLVGGPGWDRMRGGAGSDTFVFDYHGNRASAFEYDIIEDFQFQVDAIDLRVNAEPGGTKAIQPLEWVNEDRLDADFTSVAGQLRFEDDTLSCDIDGDGKADFQIDVGEGLTIIDVII